ncbi:MAG: hypothetical protein QXV17_07350 [Candidatus Micrarchaeaceae archaeon]
MVEKIKEIWFDDVGSVNTEFGMVLLGAYYINNISIPLSILTQELTIKQKEELINRLKWEIKRDKSYLELRERYNE